MKADFPWQTISPTESKC